MHHHSSTDPAHQQALGLVGESNLSDSGEEEGSRPCSDDHDACIGLVVLYMLC